jgi:hypothetical protein
MRHAVNISTEIDELSDKKSKTSRFSPEKSPDFPPGPESGSNINPFVPGCERIEGVRSLSNRSGPYATMTIWLYSMRFGERDAPQADSNDIRRVGST